MGVSYRPCRLDAGLQLRAKKHKAKMSDAYKEGVLMTFEEISLRNGISRNEIPAVSARLVVCNKNRREDEVSATIYRFILT